MEKRKISIRVACTVLCVWFLLDTRYIVFCVKRWAKEDHTEESDEQKPLQQALFLVNLLKSEYARVLKENNELQKMNFLREQDSATCATVRNSNDSSTNAGKEAPVKALAIATTDSYWLRSKRMPSFFPRRRFRLHPEHYGSYFYYDVPIRRHRYEDYRLKENTGGWRRFQYEDVFGPQPGGTNSPNSPAVASTKTITSTIAETSTTNVPSTANTLSVTNTFTSTNVQSTTNTPLSSNTNIEFSSYTPYSTYTTASIMTSTSSPPPISILTTTTIEMEKNKSVTSTNELKDTTSSANNVNNAANKMMLSWSRKSTTSSVKYTVSTIKSTLLQPQSYVSTTTANEKKLFQVQSQIPLENNPEISQAAAELEMEIGPNLKLNQKYKSIKLPTEVGTTRIHLAGSSRYPLPLPENHAFCFTNPNSALCRTFI